MNAKLLLASLAIAAVSGVAHADEADASQYVVQFQGSRTRAEVQAEAATVSATRSTEPAGSRVAASLQSNVDAKVLHAQAVEMVRSGKTSSGELSF
jgi:hypothetical protein